MKLHDMKSILIVDDDKEILQLLKSFLSRHGYQAYIAERTEMADKLLQSQKPDLLILDVMMPGEDGLAYCRRVRAENNIPIVMLTALGEETDRIVGLELGADDYLPKPFNPRELLARVKAVLRRSNENSGYNGFKNGRSGQRLVSFENWQLNMTKRELKSSADVLTSLTAGEYELLLAFIDNPQRVLNRDQLLDITRGRIAGPFDRSIDVQLSRLRKKIEPNPKDPSIIKTVRNGGYIFTPDLNYA
jgi:two-component system OmpR family response regulator